MSISGRTPAECPVCGAPIHPKDRFCAACGADVVANGAASDSLLDEVMPAGEERTAELPAVAYAAEPTPSPFAEAAPPVSTDPVAPAYADAPPPRYDDAPRRGSLVLPVVLLVAVLLVAVLAWRFVFAGGDDPQTASGTTSTSSAPAAPTDEPSSAEPSPSEDSPSPSASDGPQRITLASTAEQCGDVGGAAVYRGNEVTTCEFALAVAKALGTSEVPTRLSARSPVTKRDYAMDCEDTAPVTCRGGNEALVYVDRG